MDNLSELAAVFNNREITDDTGKIKENENSMEESAPQEKTEIEETTEAEKPAESEEQEQKPVEEDETQPVVDEEGKKYIPEKRFKEVYAKGKQAERKTRELEAQLRALATQQVIQPSNPVVKDKADALEVELLFTQYPQFDPADPNYSEELDEMAAGIYQSGRVSTKLDAAKQALRLISKFQNQMTSIKQETKNLKRAVSENIVSRGGQRKEPQANVDNMSVEELENHLKSTGQWLP